jgi:16S rRNA (guanine1207-N2)-methyltransferase
MNDAALDFIFQALQDHHGKALLVLDENLPARCGHLPDTLDIITNRFDVYSRLQTCASHIEFSDFDFSRFENNSLDNFYYRTSKEKAVVHHVLNAAARLLKPGGHLYLAGHKQEGIQTYIKKSAQLLGSMAEVTKNGPARMGTIQKKICGETLDDQRYDELRLITDETHQDFYTKPGVFGWDKIDQGSALLVQHLDALQIKKPTRLLDLGCGYGYLSVKAQTLHPVLTHATDNNAAAIRACKKNFGHYGIEGDVFADDCAASLAPGYDIILCNPPFHQGFDTERMLTEKFVSACRRLLAPQGQALFVVNSFIPLEKIANDHFNHVQLVTDNRRFRIIKFSSAVS